MMDGDSAYILSKNYANMVAIGITSMRVNNSTVYFTIAETGEEVEYIDYRDPKDVYIKIPTVNIRLGSLNPSTFKKIQRLPSLLPQVKMINQKVKYIDLRWDNSNFIKLGE